MIPTVLVCTEFPEEGLELLRADFRVLYAPTSAEIEGAISGEAQAVDGVVTRGSVGLLPNQLRALKRLRIIAIQGAGHEKVDLPLAQELGIVVTSGQRIVAAAVADHAMALLLCVTRGIPWTDWEVRRGKWDSARGSRPTISGKRLGILGLGSIGGEIAKRAAGFGMRIAYHNRKPISGCPFLYERSPVELAAGTDMIVVCCPGGSATRHIVDEPVLTALGPNGFLINVGRGSVVDTGALIAALHANRIGGAALDVVEEEPNLSPALLDAPNLILTPHMAARSPDSVAAAVALVHENLRAYFGGRPVTDRIV